MTHGKLILNVHQARESDLKTKRLFYRFGMQAYDAVKAGKGRACKTIYRVPIHAV